MSFCIYFTLENSFAEDGFWVTLSGMKYSLVSLGCQMNLSDVERVSLVLEAMGYEHTESEEEASILGLVSCSVR